MDNLFEEVVICAIRYALGRRTYVVEDICNYIESILPDLSIYSINIIIRDIKDQESWGYGDECDKTRWMRLLDLLEQRKHNEEYNKNIYR